MLKWESVHKKRKTLILTILWMAFCTKRYYIKFRKQPQITVYRNVQHGNQSFGQKYLTETHTYRTIYFPCPLMTILALYTRSVSRCTMKFRRFKDKRPAYSMYIAKEERKKGRNGREQRTRYVLSMCLPCTCSEY